MAAFCRCFVLLLVIIKRNSGSDGSFCGRIVSIDERSRVTRRSPPYATTALLNPSAHGVLQWVVRLAVPGRCQQLARSSQALLKLVLLLKLLWILHHFVTQGECRPVIVIVAAAAAVAVVGHDETIPKTVLLFKRVALTSLLTTVELVVRLSLASLSRTGEDNSEYFQDPTFAFLLRACGCVVLRLCAVPTSIKKRSEREQ